MRDTIHDRKLFLPGILFRGLGFLISQARALFELWFYLATFWLMLSAKWLLQRRDRNAAATETGEKP